MPTDYILITDDSCDLPNEYLDEHNIKYLCLSYSVGDTVYTRNDLPAKEFYQMMRSGQMPITTQVNQQSFTDFFTGFLEQGKDILYLAFSSGLSGTCNSGKAASQALQEKYPDRKIYVVDSLCASLGQGLFVHKVREKRDEGYNIDDLKEYAESIVPHISHRFTVDDLMHLHRGGRVSKTSAIAGSLLGIKPTLYVDDEGHLLPVDKVRGRKAAITKMVDEMEAVVGDTENDIFMISHGDCIEDAQIVIDMIKERFGIDNYILNYVGPVIGTHSGPGTLALFMMADKRKL